LYPNKPAILLVDDDLSILHAFRRIFERKGYTVMVAEKGKDAIQQLNRNHFDVAVIDFGLPDMEGTKLFPIIEQSWPKTLKIMLTGKTHLANAVEGVDEFLGKPLNPEKLLSIIDTKLRNRNME
jgi:DNA-binding NtrC family response regulator